MALEVQVQQDFSAGMFQSPARELIPPNGCWDIVNGLLEADGSIYKRGGSATLANVGSIITNADITFLWDGYLYGGARTVYAGATQVGTFAPGLININPSSTTVGALRPAVGNGTLVIAYPGGGLYYYAGSLKGGTYSAGSLTVAAGDANVTGSGTSWLANLDRGSMLRSGGVVIGIVEKVLTDTTLLLRNASPLAYASSGYTATPDHLVEYDVSQLGLATAIATISNPSRLVVARGTKISFSAPGNFLSFDPTDYHELSQGAEVLGMESLRNALFVFSTQGIFTISGMDFDLTDASGNVQHRLEQINRDIILWDQRGIAGWSGSLIVPGTDDVYLVSDTAAPRPLSAPIRALYRSYVAAGWQCGTATVYRNHYFLPILSGDAHAETLVCRLDGGGWTRWTGHGAQAVAFATRGSSTSSRSPKLLSAYGKEIKDLTGTFAPTQANALDADGSTYGLRVETRDYTTGGLRKNLVKKLRLGYSMTGTGSPTLSATVNTSVSSPDAAPTSDGTDSFVFKVGTVRSRFVRSRFDQNGAAATLVLRSVEVFTRQGGRQ